MNESLTLAHVVDGRHAGHETLHQRLVFAILFLLLVWQAFLLAWRALSPHTFRRTTLLGAWLVCPIVSFLWRWWLPLLFWLLYTVLAARLVWSALRVPLPRSTPRAVYAFFLDVFRISQFLAGAGYFLLCVEFLMPSILPFAVTVAWIALQLIGFGLYFGMLGRDTAEWCSDRMAATLGFGSRARTAEVHNKDDDAPESLPRRMVGNSCAICALPLVPTVRDSASGSTDETIVTLNCEHRYHEMCLRGWSIVGKKSTCAVCGEKSVYDELSVHPWQRTSALWAQLLDAMGWLLVWNPLIIMSINLVIVVFD